MFHAFVEALCASPELVCRYNDLKLRHEGLPMSRYREAKAAFVSAVLGKPS